MQLAHVFEDTRWIPKAEVGQEVRWPVGQLRRPDGQTGSGGYISPCLFVTTYRVLQLEDGSLLNSLQLSNETDHEGKFQFQHSSQATVVKTAFKPASTIAPPDTLNFAILRDPACRGGIDGYLVLEQYNARDAKAIFTEKIRNFRILGAPHDKNKPEFDGNHLVANQGCDIRFILNDKVYHDCESTEGSSGSLLINSKSLENLQKTPNGAPLWKASAMHVSSQSALTNKDKDCSLNTCNIAIDASALRTYAQDLIEEDIARYNSEHPPRSISADTQNESGFASFLGEWVVETESLGIRSYSGATITETPDAIVFRSTTHHLPEHRVPKASGSETVRSSTRQHSGIRITPGREMTYTTTTTYSSSQEIQVTTFTVIGPDRLRAVNNTSNGAQWSTVANYYRRESAPQAFQDLDTDIKLAAAYDAAMADLQPLLAFYRRDKYWESRTKGFAELGTVFQDWYLSTLWNKCNPVTKDVKERDLINCLRKESPRYAKSFAPFADWIVRHAPVVLNANRLDPARAKTLDTFSLGNAWAELAAAYQQTGLPELARAEVEKAAKAGFDLSTIFDQWVKSKIAIVDQVRAESRQERAGGASWLGVLRDIAVAYNEMQGRVPVGSTSPRPRSGPSINTTPTVSARPAAGVTCGTLQSMGLNFPRLGNAEVDRVRDSILNENIGDAIAAAKGQGLSKAVAIAQINQQAAAADQAKGQAEACITSSSADGPSILQQLRNRNYSSLPKSSDMLTSCIASYVKFDLQAAANRASARAFQSCWP